jgi:hypothetical protein
VGFVLLLALLGAASGLWMGQVSPLGQTGSGTSSGSSGGGTSASGSSGDGTSASGSSGDGSSGSSGDGSSGSSGDGSSGESGGGSSGSGGGTDSPATTASPRPGTPTTGASRRPTSPRARIPEPKTPAPVATGRVRQGEPIPCRSDAPPDTVCFKLGPGGDIEYIRVPDGAGGFVTLPVGRAPVFGDSGASVSVDNNTTVNNVDNSADLQVEVNMQTGEVVRFERRPDEVTQAIFGTLAALLLVLVASGCGAIGFRRYGRGL